MKTKHQQLGDVSGNFRRISTILHILSMVGILWLRKDFGYVFFRPKRILIPTALISVSFSVLTLVGSEYPIAFVKAHFFDLLFFGVTPALYICELIRTVWKLNQGNAKHLQYSGTSEWLPKKWRGPKSIIAMKIIGEPLIVFFVGVILLCFDHEGYFMIFSVVAISIFVSEFLNYWFEMIRGQITADAQADAETPSPKILSNLFDSVPRSHTRSRKMQHERILHDDE